jgi:hypothetical protein
VLEQIGTGFADQPVGCIHMKKESPNVSGIALI